MSMINHITDKPFVLATGLAALIHSTWSLGTLFSGEQPPVEDIESIIQFVHFIGWLLPALLMAIALDVGQIVTSHDIRTSGLSWQRGLTFFVFGFATYYLQWLYIALHMPALELANGVSDVYSGFAVVMRDSAMWLIPSLLPLSTILYTFSGKQSPDIVIVEDKPKREHETISDYQEITDMPFMPVIVVDNISTCEDCGWKSENKASADSAARALRAHKLHCKADIEAVANVT